MILQARITATQNPKLYALSGFYNISPWALIRAIPALLDTRTILGFRISLAYMALVTSMNTNVNQFAYIHTTKNRMVLCSMINNESIVYRAQIW